MTNLDIKKKIWIILSSSVVLAFVLSLINKLNLNELSSWMTIVPQIISVELFFYWLFKKFLWQHKIFSGWLVLFPSLDGTWIGEMQSNYINPETKEKMGTIPCMAIIVHNFDKITIKMVTLESVSFSFSEKLEFVKEKNEKLITYSFINDPSLLLDYRSNSHKGTAILLMNGKNKMTGSYYTNRGTKGLINLERFSKKKLDEMPEEIKRHPLIK